MHVNHFKGDNYHKLKLEIRPMYIQKSLNKSTSLKIVIGENIQGHA